MVVNNRNAPIPSDDRLDYHIVNPRTKVRLHGWDLNPNPKPLADWAVKYRMMKDLHLKPTEIDELDTDEYLFYRFLIEAEDKKLEADQKKANDELKAKRRR